MKRAKKGFTLIEVICVLVIIAIVAVIAVPNISKYIDNSKINNCRSTMNGFLNDLEYRIVSKRYYDIDELNKELVGVADAAADELTSTPVVYSGDDGKFKSLEETITGAAGICPNGGHYTVRWTITPGSDENTARVKLESCICDCMNNDEKNVHLSTAHEFTAALITAGDYLKSGVSKEDTYREDIVKIIDYINSRLNDPSDINDPARIDDIIRDYEESHKNDAIKYDIKGVTVKENAPGSGNTNWVEWISVSLNTDYDNSDTGKYTYDFITYYPEKKDGSSSHGAVNDLQSGNADGKLVINTIETEDGNEPDRKDWPPVEGTSGSYYYLKDFNYANNKNYQIADIDNADIIQFIQRDTNWYVQKTNSTAGINSINSIAENVKGNYPLVSNDWLKDGETLGITNEEALNVYMNPNASNADFRDIFLVQPKYSNGSGTEFGHLQASDLNKDNDNDYFIKNGYILVSSPEDVKDADGKIINWAGVWADEYDEEGNKIDNSERENLKQLLRKEDQIVSDVFRAVSAGDYKNGEEGNKYNEITVAYQEYYKTSDKVEAYTNFGTIRIYQPTDSSEDAVIKSVVNGTETAIGYISVKDVAGSYNINVKEKSSDGKFSTDDLEITKKVDYLVKDTNGNVKSKETNTVTLKAGVDYYIGTADDIKSNVNNTSASIEKINNGQFDSDKPYFIYIPGKGEEGKIGKISAGEVKKDTLKWEYNKGATDDKFDLNKISVWYERPILITDLTVTPNKAVEYSISKDSFKHKESDKEEGWYLVEKDSSDDKNNKYSTKNEELILSNINDYESDAVVKLYTKDSSINNKKLFDVQTRIESLSENHEIRKVEKRSGLSIWDLLVGIFTGNFSSSFNSSDVAIGLDVKANYGIKVVHSETTNYSVIHFNRQLNHDSTTSWGRLDFDKRRFFVYNSQVSSLSYDMEKNYIDNLSSTSQGSMYIYYKDNYSNISKSKKYDFNVYTKFDFVLYEIPDFVYYRDAGDGLDVLDLFGEDEMHIEGYIGNDTTINIPATVEGRWEFFKPSGTSYPVKFNGETIYYVPDGKTYPVDRVGKGYQKLGQTIDEYKFVIEDDNVKNHLVSINIAEGIREVDDYTFAGLGELESITLPSSLEKIDVHAFEGVTLKGNSSNYEFVIPENVKEIYQYAFKDFTVNGTLRINGCAYNGLISNPRDGDLIGYYTNAILPRRFTGAKFNKLVFGPKVQTIEDGAFSDNESAASLDLGSVRIIKSNAFSNWKNATGSLYIPKTVQTIGSNAFMNFASDVTVQDNYPSLTAMGGTSLSTLNGAVFSGSHFNNVTIGGNVSSISESSFSNENGKYSKFKGTLRIENSVSNIGSKAFKNCTGFNGSLILPQNSQFKKIYAESFRGCSGFSGDLDIPSSVTEIESYAFDGCSGMDGALSFGTRLSKIGQHAFSGWENAASGLAEQGNLTIPDSVTSIGERAFDGFASKSENIEKYPSLTINGGSFSNGTALGALIFTNSKFKDVTIGGRVTNIDDRAFRNATGEYKGLCGTLTISDSVTRIGKAAFERCAGSDDGGGIDTLKFGSGSKLTSIGDAAFSGCLKIKGDLEMPSELKTIGSRAFTDCLGFNGNLILNDKLEKIGMEAFRGCSRFTGGLTIPSSVKSGIGNLAFSDFASKISDDDRGELIINSGSMSEGTKLGSFIFTGSKFNGITIGGNVTEISAHAFHHDNTEVVDPVAADKTELSVYYEDKNSYEMPVKKESIKAIYDGITGELSIGDSVRIIGENAFENLSVTSLTGTRNVELIGAYAFKNCTEMASDINFGGESNLISIGAEAFYGDSSIVSVSVPDSVTSIGRSAFESSGSGEGRLVIYGSSGTDSEGRRILGNETLDSTDSIFNHAHYKHVDIGGNVEVIGYRFMKTYSPADYDYTHITGDLTITGKVREIKGEAFNEGEKPKESELQAGSDAYRGPSFNGTLTLNSDHLETIGYSAFENLSNMRGSLTIPQSVHNIDRRAFKKFAMNAPYSELGTLSIKGYSESNRNQKIIGYRIFSFARFKSVEIGGKDSSVNTIGNFAFYNSNLAADNTDEDLQKVYEVFNSGSGYTEEDIKVYRNLKYNETTEGVKVNNDNSNYSHFTESVKILDGIETIGTRAFGDNYSILEVKFESSTLKTIGKDAFNRCTKAGGGLTIPKTVTSIGRCAFKQFGENTNNPGTLTILGYSDASPDGKIRYIGIPLDDINNDPKPIFPSAKFKNVVIGGKEEYASVNAIGDKFMNNLKPSDPTYNYSGITGSLTIGESITSIGKEAFVLCTGFDGPLTLNENLKSIGQDAFNACNGFRGDLLIPSTVESIGQDAFKHFGQGNLSDDYNQGSLTVLGYSSVNSDNKRTIDANIFNHAHFRNITIGGNVDRIADDFMNNERTEKFDEQRSVTMFNGVYGDLTIMESVSEIGNDAFYLCKNLKGRLNLHNGLNSIGEYAFAETRFFEETEGEKNLTIPETVTFIGKSAFECFCEGVSEPPSLTILGYSVSDQRLIGSQLFDYACFRNVTIGGNVKALSGWAFCDFGNKFRGFTGTLTIIPYTVGFDNGEYIPLEKKFDESGIYYGGGMSIGTDNSNRFGTFRGCYFDRVVLPEELYNMYMDNQYDLFGQYDRAPKNQSFVYEIYR